MVQRMDASRHACWSFPLRTVDELVDCTLPLGTVDEHIDCTVDGTVDETEVGSLYH